MTQDSTPPLSPAQPAGNTTKKAPDRFPTIDVEASISTEVPNDSLRLNLCAERDGEDSRRLNEQVIGILRDALETARAWPSVTTRIDDIRSHRQEDEHGRFLRWKITGCLILESRDFDAMGQLAGALSRSMTISDSTYSLSEARRHEAENGLLPRLGEAFLTRARLLAESFGFSRYVICKIDMGNNCGEPSHTRWPSFSSRSEPLHMVRLTSRPLHQVKDEETPHVLPMAPGKTTVTVSATGILELH